MAETTRPRDNGAEPIAMPTPSEETRRALWCETFSPMALDRLLPATCQPECLNRHARRKAESLARRHLTP